MYPKYDFPVATAKWGRRTLQRLSLLCIHSKSAQVILEVKLEDIFPSEILNILFVKIILFYPEIYKEWK